MVLKDNTKRSKSSDAKKPSGDKQSKATETKDKAKDAVKEESSKIEELQSELTAEKDRVLRLSAEFENFKKRKQKEIEDFRKFANESIFRQLLTVVDNLERAIDSAEDNTDTQALIEGIKLTYKEILKMFDTFNVKLIDAKDKPFDPNFHQAVTQTETDDCPENTVMTELQKGYTLNDRLLRASMVVVSKSMEKNKKTK